MAIRIDTRAADFNEKFRAFLDTKREVSADVEATVRAIVADVVVAGRPCAARLHPDNLIISISTT